MQFNFQVYTHLFYFPHSHFAIIKAWQSSIDLSPYMFRSKNISNTENVSSIHLYPLIFHTPIWSTTVTNQQAFGLTFFKIISKLIYIERGIDLRINIQIINHTTQVINPEHTLKKPWHPLLVKSNKINIKFDHNGRQVFKERCSKMITLKLLQNAELKTPTAKCSPQIQLFLYQLHQQETESTTTWFSSISLRLRERIQKSTKKISPLGFHVNTTNVE
ncbi:hypothetical protein HPP92_015186 [Vanilla planifolia]|uniref:Uncharacterized protein n=1 Tax=Vanilla planifolia TaxID=51239 RepID=A0A835QIP8_VANPL|nr:hypothetical protein HPP92_015186 [Vanilla planifolia]